MMLDTAAAFNAVVRRYAADAEQADRIVANAFFRNMAGSLSGTQEYMAAETLHLLAGDDRFDLVVVDTPPTRSALDFLAAPGCARPLPRPSAVQAADAPARPGMRMINVATQPVLRAIGKVVGSEVLADAVAFFQAFAGMEGGFRQRADDVIALLRAPSTLFVLVASPRREAVGEAAWFAGQLAEQGIDHVAGVANRVHPPFGDGSAAAPRRRCRRERRPARCGRNLAELRAARAGAGDARRVRRPVHRHVSASRCRSWRPTFTTATAWPTSAPTCSATIGARVHCRRVRVLLAMDVDWLVDDVVAALGDTDTSFTVCTEGRRGQRPGRRRRAKAAPTTS